MPKKDGPKAKVAVRVASKQARAQQPPSSAHEKPVFCFAYADRNGDERWGFNPAGDDASELLQFLRHMGQLTWSEIERARAGAHKKHHEQEVESLDPAAQRDFRRYKLGERFGETIFRFG